jgi:hypothetical protein
MARAMVAVALAAVALGGSACDREGPAERAGEQLDRARDKVSDAIDPKGPAEKAGRAIDRATGADEE